MQLRRFGPEAALREQVMPQAGPEDEALKEKLETFHRFKVWAATTSPPKIRKRLPSYFDQDLQSLNTVQMNSTT